MHVVDEVGDLGHRAVHRQLLHRRIRRHSKQQPEDADHEPEEQDRVSRHPEVVTPGSGRGGGGSPPPGRCSGCAGVAAGSWMAWMVGVPAGLPCLASAPSANRKRRHPRRPGEETEEGAVDQPIHQSVSWGKSAAPHLALSRQTIGERAVVGDRDGPRGRAAADDMRGRSPAGGTAGTGHENRRQDILAAREWPESCGSLLYIASAVTIARAFTGRPSSVTAGRKRISCSISRIRRL